MLHNFWIELHHSHIIGCLEALRQYLDDVFDNPKEEGLLFNELLIVVTVPELQ